MAGSEDESRKGKNAGQCEWGPGSVCCLLDSYAEKYASGRGYLRTKDWEEVVRAVNVRNDGLKPEKTMKQCRDKVDSLKKRYKQERKKAMDAGLGSSGWPFYAKLDAMMGSVPKQARIPDGVDAGRKLALALGDQDPFEGDEDNMEDSGSQEECEANERGRGDASCWNMFDKGKMAMEEIEGLSEDGFNTPSSKPSLNRFGLRESVEDGHHLGQKRMPNAAGSAGGRPVSKKRRIKSSNPVQALADAVVGFSEVFARIEIAKMEIYTKMKLEMAKLHSKRRKRKAESSSSSGSET